MQYYLEKYQEVIIIDSGTATIKAGLSSQEEPSVVLPTIIGKKKKKAQAYGGQEWKDFHFGKFATNFRTSFYDIEYPIQYGGFCENGLIDNLKEIWGFIFEDLLRVKSIHYPVIITVPIGTSKHTVNNIIDLMFCEFRVPALCITTPAVLALLYYGQSTGVVCDSGAGGTRIVPIFDQRPIRYGYRYSELCGGFLNNVLKKVENANWYEMNTSRSEQEIARQIKEKWSLDKQQHWYLFEKNHYTLPDGKQIDIDTVNEKRGKQKGEDEEFIPGEMKSIPETIHSSIQNFDYDQKSELYKNIYLAGGNCNFEGFSEILLKDVERLAGKNRIVKVNNGIQSSTDYSLNSWKGGCVAAKCSTLPFMSYDQHYLDGASYHYRLFYY